MICPIKSSAEMGSFCSYWFPLLKAIAQIFIQVTISVQYILVDDNVVCQFKILTTVGHSILNIISQFS